MYMYVVVAALQLFCYATSLYGSLVPSDAHLKGNLTPGAAPHVESGEYVLIKDSESTLHTCLLLSNIQQIASTVGLHLYEHVPGLSDYTHAVHCMCACSPNIKPYFSKPLRLLWILVCFIVCDFFLSSSVLFFF